MRRRRNGEIANLPHDATYRLGPLRGIHKALRYICAPIPTPSAAGGDSRARSRMRRTGSGIAGIGRLGVRHITVSYPISIIPHLNDKTPR